MTTLADHKIGDMLLTKCKTTHIVVFLSERKRYQFTTHKNWQICEEYSNLKAWPTDSFMLV